MPARAALPKLRQYEVLKHLASGGMADVLLARTKGIEGFERHVVIKRIRAEQASDERYVAMFLDEARLAAALHHQHVVQVHDIGQEGGEYFFTMEYVHGEDTRRLLAELSKRDQQVPLEHAISIVTAAAAGLHHAHEARGPDRKPLGIVHRDVSPANILVGYDGGVKVADFGIAKATRRNVETQSGTLKGKVAYMSPEQCVGEAVDRRSDVFSLGIVLYELLTVRRLFKGDNDFLTMTSIVLGHIPPPSKYRPELPAELEEIILKALENKPADRYQTAEEMRLALEAFAAKHALRTSTTGLADYMKSVFGERPEPWHDDEPDVEVSIDFDGSASGVVAPVVDEMMSGRIAIERSSRNFRSQTPTEVLPVAIASEAIPHDERALTTQDEPDPLPAPAVTAVAVRRGRKGWLAGGVAAVIASGLALAFVITRGPEPAPPSPLAPVPAPAIAQPAAPEVIVPPNLAAQPAPAVDETEPSTPPKRPRMAPAKKKKPARWSPSALFPK